MDPDPFMNPPGTQGPSEVELRHGALTWWIAPGARKEFTNWLDRNFRARSALETDPPRRGAPAGARVFKEYEGCRVSAVDGLVLKEYWPKLGWKGLRFAVMPSRASRGFHLARALARLGIRTPEAVAWTVRSRLFFKRASYAVTRELTKAVPLTDWLSSNVEEAAAGAYVMAAYGRMMAMFHAGGYSNRDFKHENVMCSINSPDDLWVVDLDGVSQKLLITRRRAGKDLMRVGLSLGELGWRRDQDVRAFFEGYNSVAPARLHRNNFPQPGR